MTKRCCLAATGERYSGHNHAAAATLLGSVDEQAGIYLHKLIAFKFSSGHGAHLSKA